MKYKPSIVHAYFKSQGLPEFVTELKFHLERKWKFDIAFLDERVALEVEGGVFISGRHTTGVGFVKDMEKYNAATLLGWKVLRVLPENLCTLDTVAMLKQMFGYVAIQHASGRTI